jgi:pimeloyl-ACP methyl ester carboxylesterase
MPNQTINTVGVHYDERGDRTRSSLVFAGPLSFGAWGFDGLFPVLEQSCNVIRINVDAHGRSGLRIPLLLEETADDCHELLIRLGLANPAWVGHSIGGMVGMRVASLA